MNEKITSFNEERRPIFYTNPCGSCEIPMERRFKGQLTVVETKDINPLVEVSVFEDPTGVLIAIAEPSRLARRTDYYWRRPSSESDRNWCGDCRTVAPTVDEICGQFKDVKLQRSDPSKVIFSTECATAYEVYEPTDSEWQLALSQAQGGI